MWISADPALGDYVPSAPISDDAKKHNEKLPGNGGMFNLVNMAVYHYAGNNPVRYTDPDGRIDWEAAKAAVNNDYGADHYADAANSLNKGDVKGAAINGLCGIIEGLTDDMNAAVLDETEGKVNVLGLLNTGVKMAATAPQGNGGLAKPHGGPEHDAAVDAKVSELQKNRYGDVRKNQAQVNAKGQKVGNNRPDVQGTNPETGQREYYEFDHDKNASKNHVDEISRNDPEGKVVPKILE